MKRFPSEHPLALSSAWMLLNLLMLLLAIYGIYLLRGLPEHSSVPTIANAF